MRVLKPMILLVGALAAAAAGPAVAQSYYDVEVVVFELLNSGATPNAPPNETSVVPLPPAGMATTPGATVAPPDSRFEMLPPARMLLQSEYQRLRNSKSYRPLLHQVWRQQVLGPRMSAPRSLLEQTGSGVLSGDLKVYAETFLHIDLDLTFDVPGEGSYRLHDSRRVRSKETHYFDSPRFGLLIRVTPS